MKRMMHAAVLLFALGLAGCVHAPTVELTGVRVRGIGLRAATLVAELSVHNPNPFTIKADSVLYQLEASNPGSRNTTWTRVTAGSHIEPHSIKRHTTDTIDVAIDFPYSGLGAPIRAILDRGSFNYRLSGKVFMRGPVQKIIPFVRTGNLSF